MSTDEKTAKASAPEHPGEERKLASSPSWISAVLARLGLQNGPSLRDTLEDALQSGGDEQNFTAEERQMLIRLLRFGASRVDDIMVPRADIIAIDESEPIGEVVRLFEEAGISRIPVYHETLDDPRGMVHIKDLFRWISAEAAGRPLLEPRLKGEDRAKALRQAVEAGASESQQKPDLAKIDLKRPISSTKIRRPVLYVPPSMPAMNLLIRMQTSRVHMALVVDEYGGTDGLVTIEDLVEQIVGDIEDEHDEAEADHIVEDPKQGTIASGRTPVSELESLVGMKLLTEDEEEDIDTLAGLVFQIVGRVPTRGEIIRHPAGIEFEILEADPRRVKRLKILRPKSQTQTQPTRSDLS
jgi:CBS domain containing-hemolysin-like protein